MMCVFVSIVLLLPNVVDGLRIGYWTGQGSGGGYPTSASAIVSFVLLGLGTAIAFGLVRIEEDIPPGESARMPLWAHVPDTVPWILLLACAVVPTLQLWMIDRAVRLGEASVRDARERRAAR